jgi:hypothetical protein
MVTPKRSVNNLNLTSLEDLASKREKATIEKKEPSVPKKLENPVTKKLDSQLAEIKERSAAAILRQRRDIEGKVFQAVLPFWDDDNRGVPNHFIRSGLFSVRNNEKREYLEAMKIASLNNYSIEYTGKELQQDDLSVWMALINLARNQPISDSVLFTGYQLVKDLGWSMNSKSYARAQASIERMKVTGIQISVSNKEGKKEAAYAGSLIREYNWLEIDRKGGTKWMVRFEPQVSMLFMNDTTSLLEWETRKKIGTRATVAQWLHSFYTSHRDPTPLTVEKIHEICRSGDTLSSFRATLKLALQKLIDVEFLASFHITNGQVFVSKKIKPKLIRVG